YMKPTSGYVDITLHDNLQLTIEASRAFLKDIGIAGEIISTPGHSDDSVTLVLEEGAAFTGDLPGLGFADEMIIDDVTRSWASIRALHAKMIYPAHGPMRPI
ncbi:MAG: MBL fold metallo-hydrolase, partial [Anaerolineae bacterium]|nr:MBL fold metallo-hydrolase [Anaerolineae bacterium]